MKIDVIFPVMMVLMSGLQLSANTTIANIKLGHQARSGRKEVARGDL